MRDHPSCQTTPHKTTPHETTALVRPPLTRPPLSSDHPAYQTIVLLRLPCWSDHPHMRPPFVRPPCLSNHPACQTTPHETTLLVRPPCLSHHPAHRTIPHEITRLVRPPLMRPPLLSYYLHETTILVSHPLKDHPSHQTTFLLRSTQTTLKTQRLQGTGYVYVYTRVNGAWQHSVFFCTVKRLALCKSYLFLYCCAN